MEKTTQIPTPDSLIIPERGKDAKDDSSKNYYFIGRIRGWFCKFFFFPKTKNDASQEADASSKENSNSSRSTSGSIFSLLGRMLARCSFGGTKTETYPSSDLDRSEVLHSSEPTISSKDGQRPREKLTSTWPPTVLFNHQQKEIPKKGSWDLSTNSQIINEELLSLSQGSDTNTFDVDAERAFSITLETGLSLISMPRTEEQKNEKINAARSVLLTISNLLFQPSKIGEESPEVQNLYNQLRRLNPQGLIACSMKVFFTPDAPASFFVNGGCTGGVNYAYALTPSREITITLKGKISGNVLLGKLNDGFISLSSEDHTAIGNIEMIVKIQVDDDGNIGSIACKSAKGDYEIDPKQL